MPGIKALRQIQLGRETTPGTLVAGTTRWRGLGALEDRREVTYPEEYIGIIGGGDRSYIAKTEGAMSMDETDATFEQLPHLLIASIANTTAGVTDTGGSGRVYTYNIPTTSAPTIAAYSIRAGDDQQCETMAYAFVESFSLSGAAGEALTMSAEWIGRAVANGTFTSNVPIPSVETILASKCTMYLDAVSGTYGATAVSDTLLAVEAEFSGLIAAKYVMDGSLDFDFHYAGAREITGKLRFEHNSSAVAEKANFRNQTPRLLRLKFEGSALTTSGSTYSVKTLIIDLPVKWSEFEPLDDQDGNSIVTASFVSKYNETVGNAGKFIVVLNSVASIP